ELPATQLTCFCYEYMFSSCSSLTTAPELPATQLDSWCYRNMFSSCSSLTTAPELPATQLADFCYSDMFSSCSSLTTAPELPATQLADFCYSDMFSSCSSLTTAPELPATQLADWCYSGMFSSCSFLTTAPELPATQLAGYCYDHMFYNCSSLTTAPELPATKLADCCYRDMFSSCSSLTTAPELPATQLADDCYSGMFSSCSSLTTAPELPATKLAYGCYVNMFSGCTNLKTIKANFSAWTDERGYSCTVNWVNNVSSTGIFICPDDLDIQYGSSYIPKGWTVERLSADKEIASISITTSPKTNYVEGEELDLSNGVVTITYNDKTTETIALTECEVIGFDANKVGKQTLTVKYDKVTTTFDVDVKVIEKTIVSISLTTPPTKTTYFEGEELDFSNGIVTIFYDDNTFERIDISKCEISGFDSNLIGRQSLIIKYRDVKTTFNVTVSAKYITSIAIMTLPAKTTYYLGEELDLTGGKISAFYNNNTYKAIDLKDCEVLGFDSKTIGSQTITIKYSDLTTTFEVILANTIYENPYPQPNCINGVYQISSTEDLFWFVLQVNNADPTINAILLNDIVINEDCLAKLSKFGLSKSKTPFALNSNNLIEWISIGTPECPYRGNFDGNGHAVKGVYIDDKSQDNVGLFGVVAQDAVIQNLGIEDSYIAGNNNVGSICGQSNGTIENCYNLATVKGNTNVGAIAGSVQDGVVCNSYSLGYVVDKDENELGICGATSANANVQNCYYLSETNTDGQAKTAEQFKSGEVANLLSQGCEIKGQSFKGNTWSSVDLPGVSDLDNLPTGIFEFEANQVKIWSYSNIIYIDNATDIIYIVDLQGKLIKTIKPSSTHIEIPLNNTGNYIIRTGNVSEHVNIIKN
ncbi:MAG: bacterial Ig-like domain-containing protein, partial [Bacteroidales bacterium]|nr:bacterial Ig-like domain-containing protein [Bacteroidales bacterium]